MQGRPRKHDADRQRWAVSVRMTKDIWEAVRDAARAEYRSVSGWVVLAVMEKLERIGKEGQ